MADPATSSFLSIMISWFTPTSLLFLFLNLLIGTIVLSSRFGTHKNPEQHHQDQLTPHSSPQLVRVPSLLDRVRSFNFSHYKFEHPNPEPEHVAPEHVNPAGLTRTPSLLDRVRSFNFSHYKFEQPNPEPEHVAPEHVNPAGLTRTPSLLDRVRSFNFSHYKFEQPNPEPEHVAPEHVNPARLTRTPSLLERLESMGFSTLLRSEKPDTETRHLELNETHDPSPRRENLVHRSKSESGGGAPAHHHEQIRKSVSEKSPLGGVEGNDDRRPRVEKKRSFGGDEGVDAKADDFINRFKEQLRLQRLNSLLRYKEMLQRKL